MISVKMSRRSPRVVIGKTKGVKIRCRHPSEMSGYINHTFNSIMETKKYYKYQSNWAKRRAKCFRVDNGKEVKI